MITANLKRWLESAREVLRNARALAICAGLYVLLLVTLYIFIATREATVWQVLITYAFLVLMPASSLSFSRRSSSMRAPESFLGGRSFAGPSSSLSRRFPSL